jgi:thioredoxin reductase
VEENVEIAKQLEAAGADSLHVRLGPAGMHVCQFASDLYFTGYGIEGSTAYGNQFDFSRHWEGKLIANHSGCGMMLDVAKEIKSAVSIPVGTVTYLDPAHAPDYFENSLQEGKVDFLLMNRPLTFDTEYVNKLREGRIDEIAPCTRCMHCHFDYNDEGKTYEHCRVNACTQRAYRDAMPEGYDPLPADGEKNVMVVGGGPAGMEAARIAAQRGYTVTLYEKNGILGGLMPFAAAVKGPHENLETLRAYMAHQLELKGVTVVTGQEVDADFINQQAPDVGILAAGGKRDTLGLTATSGTSIVSIDDIMTAEIGEKVTVVGGSAQAVDITLYLLAQGKNVTMVSPEPIAKLEKGHSAWVKSFVKPMIFARGTRVWPNAEIISVGNGEITLHGETGVDTVIACDTIIEAMDMLPNTAILDGITGIEAYAVGDCSAPYNMAEAIAAGNLTARKI